MSIKKLIDHAKFKSQYLEVHQCLNLSSKKLTLKCWLQNQSLRVQQFPTLFSSIDFLFIIMQFNSKKEVCFMIDLGNLCSNFLGPK